MSAITISNLRISPYTQKDTISKIVYGDEWSITVALPTPHATGDKYAIGIDYENTLYPPNRPLCAGTEAFVLQDNNLTFSVKLGTARLRDWLSSIKKPTPIAIQIVRVRNNKAETLLLDTILALPSVFDGVVTVCEGDAIQILLDAKLDKPAIDGTAGQILSLDENGQNVWRDEQEIPEQEQADWDESDSTNVSYIRNKPSLATVATSGSYNDLEDKPDLTVYVEKEAGKGLSTNDYTDADVTKLGGIEDGAEVNVQADYDESDSTADSYIRHKPVISTVGHTGEYSDLLNKPHIPADQVQADYEESDSSAVSYIKHKPTISTVGHTGSYNDLLNKPDLSVYSLITETGNKISMSIDDEYDLVVNLLDKNDNILSSQDIDLPIESMIVDATYANGVLTLTLQNGNTVDVDISDIVSGLVPDSRTVNGHALDADVTITASDLNLATVATSGSYNDLINKPVIEQADWDESDSDSPAFLKNKPHIPADQVQADWSESDSSDVSFILNKPVIPTVNDSTITINQGGVQKGSFTLNQSSGTTIDLNDGAQSDWDESDSSEVSYIRNKPDLSVYVEDSSLSVIDTKIQGFSDAVKDRIYREPVCFTALVAGAQLCAYVTNATYSFDFEYSTDRATWTPITINQTSASYQTIATLANVGDKVYVRGTNARLNNGNFFAYLSGDTAKTPIINVSGDLMSLLEGTAFIQGKSVPSSGFQTSFGYKNKLPRFDFNGAYIHADTISAGGFNSTFNASCAQHLPDITANHLGADALKQAFAGNGGNYGSVTTYDFKIVNDLAQCTRLFGSCSNLNDLTVHFTAFPTGGIPDWMLNVSATGTFRCPTALDTTNRGANYIPSGWTIVRID